MFWINEELNRTKKNPFEHNFFPFYEFLAPETDIMVQFLEPETDVKVQFLAPEIVIMGQRYYILFWLPIFSSLFSPPFIIILVINTQ